jgi:hypothetical protein
MTLFTVKPKEKIVCCAPVQSGFSAGAIPDSIARGRQVPPGGTEGGSEPQVVQDKELTAGSFYPDEP